MIKLQVSNLCYSHQHAHGNTVEVLRNIDFEVKQGEFVVILGESGCGKSTLLKLLSGLLSPISGDIRVNDRKLTDIDPAISLLFQNSTLLPWLNVRENIAFGCRIRGDMENLGERIDQYVRKMGLQKYETYYPQELSVGTAKRVDLARALVGNPKALLLDEPFAPLDYYTQSALLKELIDIWRESGTSCVFVTHDIGEAILMGQKILIMGNNPGEIEYQLEVDLDYPRSQADTKFLKIKDELLKKLGLTFFHSNST
ncbi:MAG: ABC transporter ATP-binding protein [Proteobacteria bacterium]|nr:ABC transporter ATP-binding protein [Pseudomonadota bacterium]